MLYNGIWIGPQDITSRIMETANLEQVEFLKGPSAIMAGLGAIGGTVNFVNKQPTPARSRASSIPRSTRSAPIARISARAAAPLVPGLDYRFDVSSSKIDSRIDGVNDQLNNFSGQLNYRVNDALQGVRRGRIQARRRPRLLGHAADDDGVLRAVLDPRRRRGIGDQYVRPADTHRSRHRRLAHHQAPITTSPTIASTRMSCGCAAASNSTSATPSPSRTRPIDMAQNVSGSTARPTPSTPAPR